MSERECACVCVCPCMYICVCLSVYARCVLYRFVSACVFACFHVCMFDSISEYNIYASMRTYVSINRYSNLCYVLMFLCVDITVTNSSE